MQTDKWIQEYRKIRPVYVQFTEKLKILIRDLIERNKIEYHLIEPRTKSVKSFGEKINRQDKHYADPLNEITDLSGIRIVAYYLEDVDRIIQIIKDEFSVSSTDSVDKTQALKPHEFGYRAIHYVVALSKNRTDLPEWKDYKGLKTEIQLRTVLQHAWAAIDQTLRYKKEADVPYQFRRKLFRLSGILELADEEFSSLKTGLTSLRGQIQEKIKRKDIDLEINADTLAEYIKSDSALRLAKFAKSVKSSRVKVIHWGKTDLSYLVAYCYASGLSKVKELDDLLSSIINKIPDFYNHILSVNVYWELTIPFLITYVLIGKNPKILSSKKLKWEKGGWEPSFLAGIIKFGKSDLRSK